MHLHLLNYVVGLNSFWNLAAPAIAVVVFFVGLLGCAVTKNAIFTRVGLIIAAIGVVLFLISCGVDGARNLNDWNQLGDAAHFRYGITLDDADDAALFGTTPTGRVTVAGQLATQYGAVDVPVGDKTITVVLDRLSDGSFALTHDGRELAVAR